MADKNLRDYRASQGRSFEVVLFADPGIGNSNVTFAAPAESENLASGIQDQGYVQAFLHIRPKNVAGVTQLTLTWLWATDTADFEQSPTSEVNPAGTRMHTAASEVISLVDIDKAIVLPMQVHGNRLKIKAQTLIADARYEITVHFSKGALHRSLA